MKFGSTDLFVGAVNSPSSATALDVQRAEHATVAMFSRGLSGRELYEQLATAMYEHLAAARVLREQRVKLDDAKRLNELRVAVERYCGPTDPIRDLLRLYETGLLNAPVYMPVGEHIVAVRPLTPDGRDDHEDLVALTTYRLAEALRASGVRGSQARSQPGVWELVKAALEHLLNEDVGLEGVRKRAHGFRSGLDFERMRRHRIFQLSAREILSAEVPTNAAPGHTLDIASALDEPRQPIFWSIPGLSRAGELVEPSLPPSPGIAIRTGSASIPFIEAWHDRIRGRRR
jgi:hypothetical protein